MDTTPGMTPDTTSATSPDPAADAAPGGAAWAVTAGAPGSPVILHVPHGARAIPPAVRAGILLDDDALTAELGHMTDSHTRTVAERAAAAPP